MIGNPGCFGSSCGTLLLRASINPRAFPESSTTSGIHGPPASNGLEFAIGEPYHFQQQPAVAKPRDLGLAEGACLIMDRRLDDFQVLFRGAKNQIEIAERIE